MIVINMLVLECKNYEYPGLETRVFSLLAVESIAVPIGLF